MWNNPILLPSRVLENIKYNTFTLLPTSEVFFKTAHFFISALHKITQPKVSTLSDFLL